MAQQSSKTAGERLVRVDMSDAPPTEPKVDKPARAAPSDESDDLDRAARSLERAIELAVQEPGGAPATAAGAGGGKPSRPRPPAPPQRPSPPPRPKPPANDDRAAIGKLLYGLQRRPSRSPFWAALIISLAWLAGGIAYASVMYGSEIASLSGFDGFLRTPQLVALSILVIIPILFFFTLALLVWRAQELRLMAASMSEVAVGLAEPENVASDAVNSVGQAIRREVAAMGDGVERAVARAGELEVLVQSQVAALERSYGENEIRIRRLIEELVAEREAIASNAARLRDEITHTHEGLNRDLASATEQISATLAEVGDRIADTIHGHSAQFAAALTTTGEQISETLLSRGADFVESLSEASANIGKTVGSATARLETVLDERKTALAEMLDSQGAAFEGLLSARTADISAAISTGTAEIDDALSGHMGNIATSLSARLQDVNAALDTRVQEIGDTLTSQSARIEQIFSKRSAELSETIANRASAVLKQLVDQSVAIDTTLQQRLGAIEETLGARGNEVAERLAAKSGELDDLLGEHIGRLDATLTGRAGAVLDSIAAKTSELDDALAARSQQIVDNLTRSQADMSARMGEAESKLAERMREFDASLSARRGEIVEDLTRTQADMSARMDEAGSKLAARMREFDASLSARSSEIGSRLEEQIRTMDELVNTRAVGLISQLGERGSDVVRTLEERSQMIAGAVENAGTMIERAIAATGSQAARTLAAAGADFADNLSAQGQQISEALASSGDTIIDLLASRSNHLIESVTETNEQVAGNFERILERISSANNMLRDILTVAGDSLVTVERGLSARAADFRAAIESVSGETLATAEHIGTQIAGLQEISGIVLRDVGTLASRFEEQARELRQASDAIEGSNERIDATLQSRHQALVTLTQSLSGKAEEVNEMMRSFTGMVEESLVTAERTAREIGFLLGENASQSSERIRSEFERLSQAADEESRRTLEAMRGRYSEVQGEIEAMLAEARDRFSEMTEQVQAASSQIGRELEATRAELRRGVFELPVEAAETTTALRRMIAEQLRAVDELSEIVSRHGKGLDMSVPAAEPAAANEPPRQAPARADLAGPAVRASNSGGAAAARGPASAAQRVAERRGGKWNLPDLLARVNEAEETAAAPGRAAPQAEPAAAPAADRARAPEREGGRSPLHVVESLNSLSVDLARAIDHDAPGELWERYRRGERGVFTRRLYTLRGQRNFDQIRSKYQADAEFRDTVDRYVSEFEQLLENVSRNDRDNVLTQTYLTSDTGKVYIMLAHASGRFD